MTNQCAKGKRGEREVAEWLRNVGIKTARRTQQHNGAEGLSDVVAEELPHFHIESKRVRSPNLVRSMIISWVKQLETDCPATMVPSLFFKPDAHEDYAVLFFKGAIENFPLKVPRFLVSTEETFSPHKILNSAYKETRVMNSIYRTNKVNTPVAVYEVEAGKELFALEGHEALAMMLMYEAMLKGRAA